MMEAVDRVWARLLEFKANHELEDGEGCSINKYDETALKADISAKLGAGWTESEVYGYMKWIEYFDDYYHAEDQCIRWMRSIVENVNTRLKGGA